MEAIKECISKVWYNVLEDTKMIVVDFYETLLIFQLRYFKTAKHVQVVTETCRSSYNELYEILSWMPAKAIIRLSSSLCKGLSKIHFEPHFALKQCIRSQDDGLFVQPKHEIQDYINIDPEMIESHVLAWQTPSAFGVPPDCIQHFLDFGGSILSSSNGLLLLGRRGRSGTVRFRLCNPATMMWAPLPTPDKGFKFVAEGCARPLIECYPWAHGVVDGVEFPDDYTVAIPVERGPVYNAEIHLLIYSEGIWEEELCNVSIDGRVVCHDMPVPVFSTKTLGLIVHYLCDSNDGHIMPEYDYMEPFIAAFDTRAKTLAREISLPDGAWDVERDNYWKGSKGKLWLFKWNETSMCLVRWLKGRRRAHGVGVGGIRGEPGVVEEGDE